MVLFSRVRVTESEHAYRWFCEFAAGNDAIFPRCAEWFEEAVVNGAVWKAATPSGILGLAYAYFNAEDAAWELGGLMVSPAATGKGLGSMLMKLVLGHLLFEEDPLGPESPIRVISHVVKSNADPRGLLDRMGFEFVRTLTLEDHDAPPGLRRESDGKVHGDELQLRVPSALVELADWLATWDRKLLDGGPADVSLREGVTLGDWAAAIREMSDRYAS